MPSIDTNTRTNLRPSADRLAAKRPCAVGAPLTGLLTLAMAGGALLSAGCSDTDALPAEPGVCEMAITPGPSPLRRLTRFEYNNTVRDLLGDHTRPADIFAEEEEWLGFNNQAEHLVTGPAQVEKYALVAEQIAERATDDLNELLPCSPDELGADACATQFIETFGPRAFRRPLTDDDRAMFQSLFQTGLELSGFRTGIQLVIETALQSPHFLYRVELGTDPGDTGDDVVPLTSYELASRLSYLIWGSMPDETLLERAADDELQDPEVLAEVARLMLLNPKARDAVIEFHRQWLDFGRVQGAGKSAELYPDWSPLVADLMVDEAEAFIEQTIFVKDTAIGPAGGTLTALLTSNQLFVNDELAAFYGLDAAAGPELAAVAAPDGQRAGMLTLGAVMAKNAHSNQTSPVHRGQFVREQILCQPMPLPPPEFMIEVPDVDPDSTTRERFAQHSADPACSGCHVLLDPIGFGLENFDSVGRFRTMDGSSPIDATGELTSTDVDGTFDGAAELGVLLSDSQMVQECYVKQWFRYGMGRSETEGDGCSMGDITQAFIDNGGDVRQLIISLTQTDAFRYRRLPGGGS